MKKNRFFAFILSALICFVAIGQTAYAADSFEMTEIHETDISVVQGLTKYTITIDNEIFIYDTISGDVERQNGELVGAVRTANNIMSTTEQPPTEIQHNISIASRWTYPGSEWMDGIVYEVSETVVESMLVSLLLNMGFLSSNLTTAVKNIIEDAATSICARETQGNFPVYVRKYRYCNKYVLSNMAYIWQAYGSGYVPFNVLSYDRELTY